MTALLVFLLISVFEATLGQTVCETQYHGHCRGLFGASCNAGEKSTLSHCGFLKLCCYPDPTQTHVTSRPGVTSSVHQSGTCGVPDVSRIVGGQLTTVEEFPWQVSLQYNKGHMCGGTLIDSQWILTAAHCFENTAFSGWDVVMGSKDAYHVYSNQVHTISHILKHSGFNSKTNQYDIAMVKLSKPVDTTNRLTRPACLPSTSKDFTNVVCTVTGWGATHYDGQGTRILEKVNIPIISNSMCKYYLGNVIFNHNICAGISSGGKDACQGDSGGPLVCKNGNVWDIVGIVSWGYGCGDKSTPGVYTRVSSFLDWIQGVKSKY